MRCNFIPACFTMMHPEQATILKLVPFDKTIYHLFHFVNFNLTADAQSNKF